MHTPGKGMSGSALPYKRSSPSWLKITSQEVKDIIAKMAKKGLTPSQIGVLLRDNHGVAQVSSVTNSKILRILKGQGLAPTLPEDLYCLIKKAVSVRKHMERNRKDMDSKFRLILIESRIHRLARYYKLAKKLAPNWKYDSATASTASDATSATASTTSDTTAAATCSPKRRSCRTAFLGISTMLMMNRGGTAGYCGPCRWSAASRSY